MRKEIVEYDLKFIEKIVEPAMHFVEARTGVNSLEYARFVLVLWPAATLSAAMSSQASSSVVWVTAVLALIASSIRFFWIGHLERLCSKNGTGNPERHLPLSLYQRVTSLIATILNVLLMLVGTPYATLYTIGTGGFLVHLYLATPNRAPPQYRVDEVRSTPVLVRG